MGKDGIGDNLVKQADDALEARELIKGRVLENSLLTAREAAEELAAADPQRGGAGHRQQVRALPDAARQEQAEDRAGEGDHAGACEHADRNLRRHLRSAPIAGM